MEERGTTWGEHALNELFGSDVRAGVLSWICAHPDDLIVGAKLARELEMSPSAVGKELARLAELGMLEAAEPIGAAKPYTLNQQFPLLRGLRSMCLYATGVVAVLRELFADAEGVEVAAIFGSLARGDDRPDSDVDVLVEFKPGHTPGVAFFAMEAELSEILSRKVDLNTPNLLSRYFRDKVLREADVQYAE